MIFLLTYNDQTKNILTMGDDWKLNVDLWHIISSCKNIKYVVSLLKVICYSDIILLHLKRRCTHISYKKRHQKKYKHWMLIFVVVGPITHCAAWYILGPKISKNKHSMLSTVNPELCLKNDWLPSVTRRLYVTPIPVT